MVKAPIPYEKFRRDMARVARVAATRAAAKQAIKVGRAKVQAKSMKRVRRKPKTANSALGSFGPITTIDTAPVAIGNTYTGAKPVVVPTEDGVRIQGRDYLLGIDSTAASITGWTMVGGAPLTPACMVTSTLKHFANAYAEYQIHGLAFHYITTASTAETGSVMFYVNKDRIGPGLITSSANFMPMVLSDHNTLLGPLWKNSTALYLPEPDWLATDVVLGEDLRHQAPGELFVYTRTSVTDSPGYVLIDYDISFREMQTNPRSLTLPLSRMKYTQINLTLSAASITQNGSANFSIGGTLMDGVTAAALPTGTVTNDVFKIIMNISNATFTGATSANIFQYPSAIGASAFTIVDGFTSYGVFSNAKIFMFFDYIQAVAGNNELQWGVTGNPVTVSIPCYISLVGSHNVGVSQANF